ncbi:helix-turn-helix transcriptional regulator [Moraxella bovis]|uniref:helix-turn-helix domain-containing protein n=1 Tax=Moraxella bovis TaxID=476 RepID=UPI002227E1C6|nr:helix-turn-helix transcriptional regulator [Moraxella bovis]UYZ68864.1 helix-turn-helix transcriptional regulator [Moraxella bovis]UYZ71240.1 helix-turn-helix transcriptional regulator [Moraxella bovis]UYZ72845.1 helix-turn-helix transcriptional regulator [Moraxella bovis]UZA14534.1 helix-turn-helix transcriptional regulator [Moraxella bovis]UZA27104.1 helix-turn-helix transcriptional regulator [Moraxella bovis]
MTVHKNIRLLREAQELSQETVAEQLNMSVSGYAKIERGVTKLNFDKLQKIAQILKVDIIELISADNKDIIIMANDNITGDVNNSNANYYGDNALELEKLQLTLSHYKELLTQKDNEITALKQVIDLLQNK